MTRRHDWRARLAAYIDERRPLPFRSGANDCAMFAAGAVEAMTGTDPAAAFRRRYRSEAAGIRLVNRAGYIDHVDAVRAQFEEVPVSMAQPGDLAVVPGDDRLAIGIVQGERIFLVGKGGLMTADLLAARAAFRVD